MMDIFLGFILWSSRDSSDCIVFRPEVRRLRNCNAIPKTIEFYLLQSVQTASGAYPASCSVGTSESFLGVKWPEREGDCTPPASAQVKNGWNCTPLPHMPLWCT